jgi:uncharacterized DUF497 family protein
MIEWAPFLGTAKRRIVPGFSLLGGIAVVALTGCSPVYEYQVGPRSLSAGALRGIETEGMQARLVSLLERSEFKSIGLSQNATGDIGCGSAAQDRVTFERRWGGTGVLSAYRHVWVHEFTCEGTWHIVIISSRDAEREARELRDAVSTAFEPEINAGVLHIDTRWRLALE